MSTPHLLQPIKLCSSVDQLKQQATLSKSTSTLKKSDIKALATKLNRLSDEAALRDKEGDEESAYIMYYRACEIGNIIINHRTFKEFRQQFSGSTQTIFQKFKMAVSRVEKLTASLERRYKLEIEADRTPHQSNVISLPPSPEPEPVEVKEVTPIEMKRLLDTNCSLMLLDFRDDSRIKEIVKKPINSIRIPPNLLSRGCIASHLQKGIPVEQRAEFKRGQSADYIVLMDDNSTYDQMKRNTKMQTLYDALFTYNNDSSLLKRPPVVLKGGFDNLKLHFPMFVEKVVMPVKETQSHVYDDDAFFEKIEEEYSSERNTKGEYLTEKSGLETFVQPAFAAVSYPNLDELEKDRKRRWVFAPSNELEDVEKDEEIVKKIEIDVPERKAAKPVVPDRSTKPVFTVIPQDYESENLNDRGDSSIVPQSEKPVFDRTLKPANLITNLDNPKRNLTEAKLRNEDLKNSLNNISKILQDTKSTGKHANNSNQQLSSSNLPDLIVPARDRSNAQSKDSKSQISVNSSESVQSTLSESNSSSDSQSRRVLSEKQIVPQNNGEYSRDQREVPDRNLKEEYLRRNRNTSEVLGEVDDSYRSLSHSSDGSNSSRFPMGLWNMGNTCYMNSVIQCLFYTNELRQYFTTATTNKPLQPIFALDVNCQNTMGSGGRMAANFSSLMCILKARSHRTLKPRRFKDAVVRATRNFDDCRQHDAQEFLSLLIDALHEDLNKGRSSYRIPEQNNFNPSSQAFIDASENAWLAYRKHTWSTLYDIFTGQLVSTMTCEFCSAESCTFDIFTQITVEIPEQGGTLADCLRSHFKEEIFTDAVWSCPNCQVRRKATKQIKLARFPKYLIVHLKRFKPSGDYLIKNDSSVDYPLKLPEDYLTRHKHKYANQHIGVYDLYAIVHHSGRLQSGHYTATCREGSAWMHFDDETVSNGEDYLDRGSTGYLLFYERRVH